MDVKLCPRCGAEYYAHVDECADCKVPLVMPGETGTENLDAEVGGHAVPLREGGLPLLREFKRVLKDIGIESSVSAKPDCSSGGCGTPVTLFVAERHFGVANARLEEYYLECHPEAVNAPEYHDDDICPACGHKTGIDARECPDCGLVLIFDE